MDDDIGERTLANGDRLIAAAAPPGSAFETASNPGEAPSCLNWSAQSSRTVRTSPIGPSMSSPSASSGSVALIICGALSADVREAIERNSWSVDVYPLPPLLHNRPERIAAAVDELATGLVDRYERIAIGYADCGTYRALDELCERRGFTRMSGIYCYDMFAGADAIVQLCEADPRTYFLTDFLVLGFDRLVWRELGLERFPELRDDYFHSYRRVVWLARKRTPDPERAAQRVAERLDLRLDIVDVSGQDGHFESALTSLLEESHGISGT
jgi:hypothetical protein